MRPFYPYIVYDQCCLSAWIVNSLKNYVCSRLIILQEFMTKSTYYELVTSSVLLQIYVIGSNTKLGHWKVQHGLKLSYFGEFVWLAECVMQRSDFPIKYPF